MGINVVLINPYELGRQPFGLAHPAACLRADGHSVTCLDLSQGSLDDISLADVDLIAIQLAMHTATRIAAEALPRLQALAPGAHLAAYGLYGPVNEDWLHARGFGTVLGGEFETGLRALAARIAGDDTTPSTSHNVTFMVPDRSDLAPLERHSRLRLPDGTERVMGFADATRGCKHLCRHCPVVPVYKGRFRAVPVEVVLADIRQQVAAGAEHISFGDPDFFNGPTHAARIVSAMHAEFPHLTFDAVIKVEHLLAERHRLHMMREYGLVLVISAVESVDDEVLSKLDKGHTRQDFVDVAALMHEVGIGFAPTFLAFTPWTTPANYLALLDTLAELDLVDAVPPIQLAIRLLVPAGSRLMELPEFAAMVQPFDASALGYPWRHPDPAVDRLQQAVAAEAERADREALSRSEAFANIRALACRAAGVHAAPLPPSRADAIPRHTENWYCCAEPTTQQLEGF